jgi:hypothetical protein
MVAPRPMRYLTDTTSISEIVTEPIVYANRVLWCKKI